MRYNQPDDNPNDKIWVAAKKIKKDMDRGLLFAREVRYLYTTAQRVGPGAYADLGTFKGLSSAALSRGVIDFDVDARVYSFDTFEGQGLSGKNRVVPNSVELVTSKLKKLSAFDKVILIPGFFEDSAKAFSPEFFSFIFLDGSHDYASVRQDFDTWSPLLKTGGEMAFHDSTGGGVKQLMEELHSGSEGEWEQVALERTLAAWIKG